MTGLAELQKLEHAIALSYRLNSSPLTCIYPGHPYHVPLFY
jgi:hypothetical protein